MGSHPKKDGTCWLMVDEWWNVDIRWSRGWCLVKIWGFAETVWIGMIMYDWILGHQEWDFDQPNVGVKTSQILNDCHFLVGWRSIYQPFWGSLGTRLLTNSFVSEFAITHRRFYQNTSIYRPWKSTICNICRSFSLARGYPKMAGLVWSFPNRHEYLRSFLGGREIYFWPVRSQRPERNTRKTSRTLVSSQVLGPILIPTDPRASN